MCRQLCVYYKTPPTPTKKKYSLGHKRCSTCEVWMDIDDIRCPCCHSQLRTKTKSGKKILMFRYV